MVLCPNIHLARPLEQFLHLYMRYYHGHPRLPGHLGSEELYKREAVPIICEQMILRSKVTGQQLLSGMRYFIMETKIFASRRASTA